MKPRRRRGENGTGAVVLLQRYAQLLITVGIIGAATYGFISNFATAADVERKFTQIQREVQTSIHEQRRERIQDELFRLRNEKQTPGNAAQIKRYEAQLQDVDARLRDIERERRK